MGWSRVPWFVRALYLMALLCVIVVLPVLFSFARRRARSGRTVPHPGSTRNLALSLAVLLAFTLVCAGLTTAFHLRQEAEVRESLATMSEHQSFAPHSCATT